MLNSQVHKVWRIICRTYVKRVIFICWVYCCCFTSRADTSDIQILKQYSTTQPGVVPKLVATFRSQLHQACGHVMLSTWPKDGHMLSVSCTPLHLCSCSWVLSGSRSTPWPAWFFDVLLFPKFCHLTNLWHDFLSLHDLLWPTCSFLLRYSFGLQVVL